ncbi:MAG TPA: nuclear transport factor 2 family protein [Candidatus Acidoferrales bacterium]|nr:nuclear transport factor 2 family protein [Candidatus Acidoferrales bacterium]
MITQESLQVVKDGFAAFGRGDLAGLLDLMAEDVVWEIPGAGLPLAGTYRGRDGVASFFQKLSAEAEILDFQPREFLADGNRVLVVGWERTKVRATNRTIEVDWVMAFTVRDGKVSAYRQYVDTKLLASAYEAAAQAAS